MPNLVSSTRPRGRSRFTSILLVSAISFSGVFGGVLGCEADVPPNADPIPRVRAFEVGPASAGQLRTFSGVLAAADTSPLSFGVSGTVDRIAVEVGQSVEEGQLLATLDAQPLRLKAKSARSELSAARAKVQEAKLSFERAEKLLPQRAVTKAEVETATATLRTARAALTGAQSDLEQAERDLGRAELRAPFGGVISERGVEPFQEIGSNDAAFTLQSKGALVVKALIPESLVRLVHYNQTARVEFPTLGDEIEKIGLVTLISAQAGDGNSFPVEVTLPSSSTDLRPGMTASLTFDFESFIEGKTAYLVPISALAIDAALSETDSAPEGAEVPLFIFNASTSKLELRRVRAGSVRGNQLQVFEGLEEGDQVVTAGVAFLSDGMEVELWNPEQGLD